MCYPRVPRGGGEWAGVVGTHTKYPVLRRWCSVFISRELFLRAVVAFVAVGFAACTTSGTAGKESRTPDSESRRILNDVVEMARGECSIRTPPDPRDEEVAPPKVFVETIIIEVPAGTNWHLESDSLFELANQPGVKRVASPHIISLIDTETTADFGTRLSSPDATLPGGIYFKSITLRPRFSSPDVVVVELDLALETSELTSNSPQAVPVEQHVRNTFVARDRKAAKLQTLLPGYSRGSLLLLMTPYVIDNTADLRDIFSCKVQARQRSLSRRCHCRKP